MPINKGLLVLKMESTFERLFPALDKRNPALCVPWAAAAAITLQENGIAAHVEAGTLNWPITPPHLDDGIGPTHFSYEFEPGSPLNRLMIALGQLPEMHAWCVMEHSAEIVDLTTRFLPEQCAKLAEAPWRTAPPPRYLWNAILPPGVYYRMHPEATTLAHTAINNLGVRLPSLPQRLQQER